MGTRHPYVRYATRNFLQQAFDCEPWAPTLPDDFVVVPNEIRQAVSKIGGAVPVWQTNSYTPNGNLSPQYREKFPTGRTADPTKKNRPEGLPRTGKVNVVGSTAPPMEDVSLRTGMEK
jgi:hypothetical protein